MEALQGFADILKPNTRAQLAFDALMVTTLARPSPVQVTSPASRMNFNRRSTVLTVREHARASAGFRTPGLSS